MLRSSADGGGARRHGRGRGRARDGDDPKAAAAGTFAEAAASSSSSSSGKKAIEFLTLEKDRERRRRRAQDGEGEGGGSGDVVDEGGELPQCQPCICDASSPPNSTSPITEPLRLRLLTAERSFARLQVMLEQIAEDYVRTLGPTLAPRITVVGVPSLAELEREVMFDVRTRAGQFDGYIVTPLWIGELADGLYEISDFVREYTTDVDAGYWTDILLFYREVISSYDGGLYLFPFDGDVISMFYRRDLLEKYGRDVPKTWDEYNELARFFHGRVEPLFENDPETGEEKFVRNVTLSGSCVGRMPACGNPYWAQTVLATMTQVRGTYEGSLVDSADLSPLLGPAMEETLRLLGEQTLLGVADEFEGCVGVHVEAMNRGECVLTYNWGNSFSDHVREGSYVRGKLGVAPIPGSPRVLNRETGQLEECTRETCPHSVLDERTGRYINQAPYGAFGGFSGAVSGAVSPENRLAAAQFFAFATSSKKAIKYVIPDADNPDANPVPTGMDPYARSMLVPEEWTSRGFDLKGVEEYKFAIESQLGSENVVMDIRFPRASEFFAALDEETTLYTNDTKWGQLGDDPAGRRADAVNRIAERWAEIEDEFDSAEGRSPGALLEMYQRSRGVYVPSSAAAQSASEGSGQLSTNAIVGIAVGVAAGIGLLTLLITSYVVRQERRKREQQWYIAPEDIVDTREVLGKGSFGVVTKGFLRGTPVALKHPLGYRGGINPTTPEKNGGENKGVGDEKGSMMGRGLAQAGRKNSELTGMSAEGILENEPADSRHRRYSGGRRGSGDSGSGGIYGSRQPSVSSIEINPLDASVGASLLTEPTSIHRSLGGKVAGAFNPFKRRRDADPLRAELLTLIKLRHESIVQTLGATIFDTRKKELVLVLQYMQNNTVRSILKNPEGVAGTAGMALEIQWALQVARGMGFLHSVPPPAGPMLHNDLKSSNVLVDGSYNAHISDFGLATKTMGGLWGAIRASRAGGGGGDGQPKGSLLWMAPEVLNGADPTPASDVYSYSMFLVELMTRTRPYGLRAFEMKSKRSSQESTVSGTSSRRMSEVSVGTEYDHEGRRISNFGNESGSILNDDFGVGDTDWDVAGSKGGGSKHKRRSDDKEQDEEDKDTVNQEENRASGGAEEVVDGSGDGEKRPKFRRRVSWSGTLASEATDAKTDKTEATATDKDSGGGSGSNEDSGTLKSGATGTTDPTGNTTKKSSSTTREFVAYIDGERLNRDDIISRVKDLSLDPPFRPSLPSDAPQVLRDICVECWHKNPKRRPTMKEVEERLSDAFSSENVTQQMMKRGTVFDTILPRDVQDALARGESVPPKSYDEATVIFSDIVGFTNISSALTAEEVGDLIRRLFTKFDDLCRVHSVKKLDVIGDAFLGVVGVPVESKDHAGRAARFALGAIEMARGTMICPAKPDLGYVRVRFGLASGGVVATVIGSLEHPKYTLFGDTVNTASRMESSGMPNRCQCTPETAQLLRERSPDVKAESRGTMQIKGKGEMETFWLSLAEDGEVEGKGENGKGGEAKEKEKEKEEAQAEDAKVEAAAVGDADGKEGKDDGGGDGGEEEQEV